MNLIDEFREYRSAGAGILEYTDRALSDELVILEPLSTCSYDTVPLLSVNTAVRQASR